MFIDIEQGRKEMDYTDIAEIPQMTHLGNVYYMFEDKNNKKLSIAKVDNYFFSEILLDSNNDDHHMSGDYERKFKVLLNMEK